MNTRRAWRIFSYNRYALHEGYATGSEDGKPLAPLLGTVKDYDSGASDLYVGMLNPMLIYADHAVIYRFIPIDKDNSVQEIIWLVHKDAEEGKDYDRDRLVWLWDVTTIADKLIIEKNQEGVQFTLLRARPLCARWKITPAISWSGTSTPCADVLGVHQHFSASRGLQPRSRTFPSRPGRGNVRVGI